MNCGHEWHAVNAGILPAKKPFVIRDWHFAELFRSQRAPWPNPSASGPVPVCCHWCWMS